MSDRAVIRELASRYAEIAAAPEQDARRTLWRQVNSLEASRPAVQVGYGMWNVWCREVFGDATLSCGDPFCRGIERALRMQLFHAEIGDDAVFNPWFTIGATQARGWSNLWGIEMQHEKSRDEGGAWRFDAVIREPEDIRKLSAPPHEIDEAATARDVERANELMGDILPIDVSRNPVCAGFTADISTHLAQLRGLEQLMLDMYERPEWLHGLLAFMRDGILANQEQAEAAGDWSLTGSCNQATPYCKELEAPKPNAAPRQRRELWAFCAAQEFTGISPAMHEEFLLRYQRPIMEAFGLSAYGCCEDLTRKIEMLRKVKNLRRIAVTPRANLASSVEQIGRDYVISWRPNPTSMVCCGFDQEKISRQLGEGLRVARGCHLDITLKDVETVEGEPQRLKRWVQLVREQIDRVW